MTVVLDAHLSLKCAGCQIPALGNDASYQAHDNALVEKVKSYGLSEEPPAYSDFVKNDL